MEDRLKKELEQVEEKLAYLRTRWEAGSPAMKKYIEVTAKLHSEKRDSLIRRLERFQNAA